MLAKYAHIIHYIPYYTTMHMIVKIKTIQAKIMFHIRSVVTLDDEKFDQTLNMNNNTQKCL